MSTSFEMVVCPATEATRHAWGGLVAFTPVRSGEVIIFIRRAMRNDPFDPALLRATACTLSTLAGVAVAASYDDSAGHREACLASGGVVIRTFGAADELWVPLDEDGEPIITAEPLKTSQLLPAEEYETIQNAIDLAFRAAGFPHHVDCRHVREIAFEA